MAGPSTKVKSGKRGTSLVIYDYNKVNDFTVPHNDDFTWDYAETDDVDVIEQGAYVDTLKANAAPVTGSWSTNMRADTSGTAEALLDIVYWRNYVASNWTSRDQVSAAAISNCGRRAKVLIEETICGTDVGDPSDHVTAIDKCVLKASSSLGDIVVENISFRGWVLTQT